MLRCTPTILLCLLASGCIKAPPEDPTPDAGPPPPQAATLACATFRLLKVDEASLHVACDRAVLTLPKTFADTAGEPAPLVDTTPTATWDAGTSLEDAYDSRFGIHYERYGQADGACDFCRYLDTWVPGEAAARRITSPPPYQTYWRDILVTDRQGYFISEETQRCPADSPRPGASRLLPRIHTFDPLVAGSMSAAAPTVGPPLAFDSSVYLLAADARHLYFVRAASSGDRCQDDSGGQREQGVVVRRDLDTGVDEVLSAPIPERADDRVSRPDGCTFYHPTSGVLVSGVLFFRLETRAPYAYCNYYNSEWKNLGYQLEIATGALTPFPMDLSVASPWRLEGDSLYWVQDERLGAWSDPIGGGYSNGYTGPLVRLQSDQGVIWRLQPGGTPEALASGRATSIIYPSVAMGVSHRATGQLVADDRFIYWPEVNFPWGEGAASEPTRWTVVRMPKPQ